jgi:thiol:disulfide interchange protein/DsbC/DsbD-like thiol-disulfide interchange protein
MPRAMSPLARLTLLLLALFAVQPAYAAHMSVTAVAETQRPAPGKAFAVAVVMDPAAGWHGYWRNPGDAGASPELHWTTPPGTMVSDPEFPVPQRLSVAGIMNYVYEGEHALIVQVTPPAHARGAFRLAAKINLLVCSASLCVPEKAEVSLPLTIGDGRPDPAAAADFTRFRQALPRPLGVPGRFALTGATTRLSVPLPGTIATEDAYFFPLTGGLLDHSAPQTAMRAGDRLVIETRGGANLGAAHAIDGVLALPRAGAAPLGLTVHLQPGVVAPAAKMGAALFFGALAAAILGGLVLNLMPCVFPILSLKAISLARAGTSAAVAQREGLAYAAGAVLACLALGGVMLGLRAGGHAVGWAFQLQEPRVVLALLVLVTAIALNLAGLFVLGTPDVGGRLAERGGASGAFWTGALAAVIATPCTGPFMGAALGASLILPGPAALALFGGLGLGLALPFVAVGLIPRLRSLLPRPGRWMERLRNILAVPMFVTALGLIWLLGRQAGNGAIVLGLAAALIVALALWWIGARQRAGRRLAWWPLLPALVAVAVLEVLWPAAAAKPAELRQTGSDQPYSAARLNALRREGRPVFVYLTADWCLTCKVNEATVIDRATTRDAFAKGHIAVLRGDWTDGNRTVGALIESFGRAGVPLYIFYPAAGGAPRLLPQILTPSRLAGLRN